MSAMPAPPSGGVKVCFSTESPIEGFIGNLRVLRLHLKSDWPSITAEMFTAKDTPENLNLRIRCVVWALIHLFAIWDPMETKKVRCMPSI